MFGGFLQRWQGLRGRWREGIAGGVSFCFALLEVKTKLSKSHFEELEKYTNKTSNNLVDHIYKIIY
jgi:hypothetical protein